MTYCNCNEHENLIERVLRIAIIAVVVISMIVPVIAPRVFAASSVTISGGDNVKGGDTFTVAVTFGGGNVGRVDGQLTYDTDKLTYLSGGSSSGNSGYIQLSSAGTDGSITFNIEFQAISEGTTDLEVTTNNMYDLDDNVSGSKSISISGAAASEEIITQTTSPEQPVAETELIGVDEKTDDDNGAVDLNMILIIAAIILVILIVVISVVLGKKRKKGKKAPMRSDDYEYEENIDARDDEELLREQHAEEERARRQAVKKRASEETKVWDDWKNMDDNDKMW